MWSKKNEEEFQNLLKKYKENPHRILTQIDKALIDHLMECYLSVDLEPGAEIPFLKKLINLYNIFLVSYADEHPKIFEDRLTFKNTISTYPLKSIYPSFKQLIFLLSLKYAISIDDMTAAYEGFLKPPLVDLLSSQQKEYLTPNSTILFPYDSPELNSEDIFSLSYNKAVQKIYDEAQLKNKEDLKLMEEKNILIQAFYRYKRSLNLSSLNNLYEKLDPLSLVQLSHICYKKQRLYPEHSVGDILPHPFFEKIVKLFYQNKNFPEPMHCQEAAELRVGYQIIAQLLGKIVTEKNQGFFGYKVLPKIGGKELGFILISPDDNKKYYAKDTENIISEYFCSKVLTYLGIKMPEAQLLTDDYNNKFYVTMDLSRTYTKESFLKTKKFTVIKKELETTPQLPPNFEPMKNNPPEETQEEIMQKFLKEIISSKKSRKSCAKILLVVTAFGLIDLVSNTTNIGLIRTQKGHKHYCKFGMVDFVFSPRDITQDKELDTDLLEYIKKALLRWHAESIFKTIFEKLSSKDFLAAAEELATPKIRTYTKEGLLLTNRSLLQTTSREVIEANFKELGKELSTILSPQDYKNQMEQLTTEKDTMIKNLDTIIASARRIKPKPVGKRENYSNPITSDGLESIFVYTIPGQGRKISSEEQDIIPIPVQKIDSEIDKRASTKSHVPLLFSPSHSKKEPSQDERDMFLRWNWEHGSNNTYVSTQQTTIKKAENLRELLKQAGINTHDIQIIGDYRAKKYQVEVSKKQLEEVLKNYGFNPTFGKPYGSKTIRD